MASAWETLHPRNLTANVATPRTLAPTRPPYPARDRRTSCSWCADSGHGVLRSVRGERREDSRAKPTRGLGRGTRTSRSRPPSVTPIASGLGNFFHLLGPF